MNEIWKPVIGYEGFYEVSDLGNVRSVDRVHEAKNSHTGAPMVRRRKGEVKAQTPDKDGYMQVRLCKNGKARTLRVHRLVLNTFTGHQGDEGCHKNHDKRNNRLSNLEWGSRLDNENQKDTDGRRPRNTRKLASIAEVVWTRLQRMKGRSYGSIAKEVGRSVGWVVGVSNGKIWREVP